MQKAESSIHWVYAGDWVYLSLPGYPSSLCHLWVSQDHQRTLLVVTELPYNPGRTITNSAEFLVTQLRDLLEVKPEQLILIQRTPDGEYLLTFEWVHDHEAQVRALHPRWHPVPKTLLDLLFHHLCCSLHSSRSTPA